VNMDDSLDPMIGRTPEPDRGTATAVSHTAGRAITPRDLRARLHHLEQCTSLSAEAALLAVLVARIGERECIVIHPGELVARSQPPPSLARHAEGPPPRLIGTWLRHLGFSPVGRDRLGMKYEIRWEQLWSWTPRTQRPGRGSGPVCVGRCRAPAAARARTRPLLWPRLWWRDVSPRRRDPVGSSDSPSRRPAACPGCGAGTCILEKTWLTWASDRIRRAIRQDRNLLPTVKAEWEEMHEAVPFPLFQFLWLAEHVVERAGKPRAGRRLCVRDMNSRTRSSR